MLQKKIEENYKRKNNMTKERIPWQNINLRVIDGQGNKISLPENQGSVVVFDDEIIEEITDTLPLIVIEGKKTDKTRNDRQVRVEFRGPKQLPQIVWSMEPSLSMTTKFKNNLLNFFRK